MCLCSVMHGDFSAITSTWLHWNVLFIWPYWLNSKLLDSRDQVVLIYIPSALTMMSLTSSTNCLGKGKCEERERVWRKGRISQEKEGKRASACYSGGKEHGHIVYKTIRDFTLQSPNYWFPFPFSPSWPWCFRPLEKVLRGLPPSVVMRLERKQIVIDTGNVLVSLW